MINTKKIYMLVIFVLMIMVYYLARLSYDNIYKLKQDQQKTTKSDTEPLCLNYNTPKRSYNDNNQAELLKALLDNPNEVIYKYFPKDLDDSYATHTVPLTIAALLSKGDILELGVGKFSTSILNKIAKEQNRLVVSIEKNSEWLQKFVSLNDSVNHLLFEWNTLCANTISNEKEWGLVFVDHADGDTRIMNIIKYAKKAQILIAHDSEKRNDDFYRYSLAYPFFKYHCKYSIYVNDNDYISTSLLSNSYKFEQIENVLKKTNTVRQHVVCQQNY